MATCKNCKAPIVWVETEASRKHPARKLPLDADTDGRPLKVAGGSIILTGQDSGNGLPIVRRLPKGKGNRQSHFDTCAAKKAKP